MDIEKTKSYYSRLKSEALCDCAYCRNYIHEVKAAYPKVADYLLSLGIDIEKPFETMPLEPDEKGYIEYIGVQYIVYGSPEGFNKTIIKSVRIDVTDSHPSTQIKEDHFVIEISPIRLRWSI